MARNGMKDAGYLYINIDDTWEGERDAQGNIHTNKKFPDMKALADYVHSKGLSSASTLRPAEDLRRLRRQLRHEEQDAQTYAAWGIDYLKYDWCGARNVYTDEEMQAVYQKMGDALLRYRPADRLQPLPVRPRRRLEMGRRGGRQSLAHHRRHPRHAGIP